MRRRLFAFTLVADVAQNGIASDYESVTEGAVLVATIFGCNSGSIGSASRKET